MAKATVELKCPKCGKLFDVTAYKHNRREADAWEEYMKDSDRLCGECYKAKKAEQRQVENEVVINKVADTVAALQLPSLTGSEKQIAWAEAIRAKVVKQMISHGLSVEALLVERETKTDEELAVEIEKLYAAKASVWIDRRGKYMFGAIMVE